MPESFGEHHPSQDTRPRNIEIEGGQDYKKEELIGGKFLYRTEQSGHIRIFDASGEHEFLLAEKTTEERKAFFDDLYEATLARFPGLEVELEYNSVTNIHITCIRTTQSGKSGEGFLWFVVNGDPETPWLISERIDSQEPGLARLMMARLLKEFPGTELISGKLGEDNGKAYQKKASEPGATHLECLYATPAYRYRAYVGFTEIPTDQHDLVSPKNYIYISSAPSGTLPSPTIPESDGQEW